MNTISPEVLEKINHVHNEMEINFEDFITDLKYLVSIDRGSDYKLGLDQSIAWMKTQLESLGCETEIYDDGVHGKNLVARLKGRGKGRWVIYGHNDTVWPKGTVDDWKIEFKENIATGPGVVDNTGGSLAGLYALKILTAIGYDTFEEVIFINNSDEEIGSESSRPIFLEVSKGADYAICLESSSYAHEIIGERAGASNYLIQVYGKGAHTGVSPEEGVDAGLELCHKIIEMKKVKGEDHVLHMSVIRIQAGTEVNSVCDYAEAHIKVRQKTWKEYERVTDSYQQIVDTPYVPGTTATMTASMKHGPVERIPGSDLLSATIIEVADHIGLKLTDVWCGGAADSSFTVEAGVPTMCGVGPFGQKYHTREELLDISTIVPRVTTLVGTIITLTEMMNE